MFRLVHVTDPHFRAFPRVTDLLPWAYLGKRAAGVANLVLNRRRKHKMALLQALGADMKALFAQGEADHLVLTGDIGNVGLVSEWQAAVRWLEAFGPAPRNVTVIPGNHDIYTEDVVRDKRFELTLGTYMKADHSYGGEVYPFVRFRGDDIAVVALNSCVPTGDLGAWGRLGRRQLKRLETLLTEPEVEKRTRVLLIHHPPVIHKRGDEHNLKDREDLCELLARTGVDLLLHGHDHADEVIYLPGPMDKRIPSIGAGSASYAGGGDRCARYNVYEIGDGAITWTTRAYDEATAGFKEVRRKRI